MDQQKAGQEEDKARDVESRTGGRDGESRSGRKLWPSPLLLGLPL